MGREITLRKTTLDDCAGDRLEELLAVFSTIVLKKLVLAEEREHGGVARKLATDEIMSPEKQKLMLPLVCAHRASLTALLRKKELLRSRYCDFTKVLESESRLIKREYEQLNAECKGRTYQGDMGLSEAEALIKQVRESWLGEAGWAKLVIGGKFQRYNHTILDSTFTDLFTQVERGTQGTAGDHNPKGLLENLESRVNDQQERLTRWGRYRDELRKISCSPEWCAPSAKDVRRRKTKRINLVFGDHQYLLPGATSNGNEDSGKRGKVPKIDIAQLPASTEYGLLVERMREDLLNVSRPGSQGGKSWRKLRKTRSLIIGSQTSAGFEGSMSMRNAREQDSVSDVGAVNHGMTTNKQAQQPSTGHLGMVSSVDGQQDVEHDEVQRRTVKTGFDDSSTLRPRNRDPIFGPNTTPTTKTLLPDLPEKHTRKGRTSASEEEDPELLAEAIISSIVEAGPTPAKSKPSLLERTRMSMALSSSYSIHQPPMGPPVRPAPDTEVTPKPRKGLINMNHRSTLVERTRELMSVPDSVLQAPDPEATPKPLKAPMTINRSSTLLERTRQSMSMLPTTSRQTRKSTYGIRYSQGYPINQFGTPRHQQPQRSAEMGTVLTTPPPEELFSEADYATVFKSRPKIAVSPTASLSLDSDASMLLDGTTDLVGNDSSWDSSPLTRVR